VFVDSVEVTTGTAVGTRDRILDIVVDILESDGYEAVQLREVARRSRTSLSTIYKRYPTRDGLILAALESWMDEHRYAPLAHQRHDPDESLYDGLMRVLGTIFEPWERHPEMLKAYYRSRAATGREILLHRGLDMVIPAAMEILDGVDADFVEDINTVLSSLVYGLSGRFAAGEIAITDILPTIERTIRRFTISYEVAPG
jgi:TetR/AcrR family transcriptional regulator, cholesterol catabolism regulator